jgi:hypothetical protein
MNRRFGRRILLSGAVLACVLALAVFFLLRPTSLPTRALPVSTHGARLTAVVFGPGNTAFCEEAMPTGLGSARHRAVVLALATGLALTTRDYDSAQDQAQGMLRWLGASTGVVWAQSRERGLVALDGNTGALLADAAAFGDRNPALVHRLTGRVPAQFRLDLKTRGLAILADSFKPELLAPDTLAATPVAMESLHLQTLAEPDQPRAFASDIVFAGGTRVVFGSADPGAAMTPGPVPLLVSKTGAAVPMGKDLELPGGAFAYDVALDEPLTQGPHASVFVRVTAKDGEALLRLALDGTVLWWRSVASLLPTGEGSLSVRAVHRAERLLALWIGPYLIAIDADTGDTRWRYPRASAKPD